MTDLTVSLSFKDLLNVSSDWKAINNFKSDVDSLNHDFQLKQIERVIEAIALTLPNGSLNKNIIAGNTLSIANLDYQNAQIKQHQSFFDEHLTKELAFDLGVDVNLLKHELETLFSSL